MQDADESVLTKHALMLAGAGIVAALAVCVAVGAMVNVGVIVTMGWGALVASWWLTQSAPTRVRAAAIASVAIAALGTGLASFAG